MKRFFFAIPFLLAAFYCAAEGIAEEARKGNEKADMSYAFGMIVASDLADSGLEFNYSAFTRGFRETMENEDTRYTMDEAMDIIQTAFAAAQAEQGERNRTEGIAFLSENAKRPEVLVTPSGLQFEAISEGVGPAPGPADVVLVHYLGTLINGRVFDSTYEGGYPAEVPLDRVIPGWSEGLRMMKEGGKAKLYIPPGLAYGENGMGGAIGPNAVLVFEVDLLEVKGTGGTDSPEDTE